jgi:hypothetical protein
MKDYTTKKSKVRKKATDFTGEPQNKSHQNYKKARVKQQILQGSH